MFTVATAVMKIRFRYEPSIMNFRNMLVPAKTILTASGGVLTAPLARKFAGLCPANPLLRSARQNLRFRLCNAKKIPKLQLVIKSKMLTTDA
jgi:hypothetical protein